MKWYRVICMAPAAAGILLLLLGCSSGEDPKKEMGLFVMEDGRPRVIDGKDAGKAAPGADLFYFQRDIVFAEAGEKELRLNLAVPAEGKGPFPVILFMPAGAWSTPERSFFEMDVMRAACRGYAAAVIECRSCFEKRDGQVLYPFPAMLHDGKAAVRWLRSRSRAYGFDAERIGVVGYGSGAYLGLMLAFTQGVQGLEGDIGITGEPSDVQAAVNFVGPVDLLTYYEDEIDRDPIRNLLGGAPDEMESRYIEANPLTYVGPEAPPVLSVYGELTPYVTAAQGQRLHEEMRKKGALHTLVIKPKAGFNVVPREGKLEEQVWEFLDTHLKG